LHLHRCRLDRCAHLHYLPLLLRSFCCRLASSLQTLDLRNTNVNGSLPGITRAQRAAGVVPEERLCGSDAAGLARAINLQVWDIVVLLYRHLCFQSTYMVLCWACCSTYMLCDRLLLTLLDCQLC
jgi:hypothetical protein